MPLPQRTLALFVMAMTASAPLAAGRAALAAPAASYRATVLSVGDGDTLRVQAGGRSITIRLACIDAPETAQSPWGQQSRAYLMQRLPRGRQVKIQPHTTDRYGRTVAEVIGDINVNLVMVEDGQVVPPKSHLSSEWAQLLSQAMIDRAIVSSWCHPRSVSASRPPSWSGLATVPLGVLPLQLFIPVPLSPEKAAPRRVLLPKRAVSPLLHEALSWHGFQLEEQPLSCQDVPTWLKRMRDR